MHSNLNGTKLFFFFFYKDEEQDDDIYIYPIDVNVEERQAYRGDVRASKEFEWRRQEVIIFKSEEKRGNTSGATSSDALSTQFRRIQNLKLSHPDPRIASSLYKSSRAKQ